MKQSTIRTYIRSLNRDVLKETEFQYDLRNVLHNPENQMMSQFRIVPTVNFDTPQAKYVTDETREKFVKIRDIIKVDPEKAKAELIKLFSREVFYIGYECERFERLDITQEYEKLDKVLNDPYILLHKVDKPTIDNIIEEWDLLKPSIIFISCHGDDSGLFLMGNDGKCRQYTNAEFVNFFKRRSNYTECIILSSCESLKLGRSISEEGKKVICINRKVDIHTATEFNLHFFEYINNHSLSNSKVFREAFDQSMEIINFKGLKDTFSFEFLDANKIP